MITYLYRFYVERVKHHGYVLGGRLLVTPTEYLGFLSVCVMYSGLY
jgi:hypothetical protein